MMLMIIPFLIQGIVAAPGAASTSTSVPNSVPSSTPPLLIPASGYIDSTDCKDPAQTRAYRVELFNSEGMVLGVENPGCKGSDDCKIEDKNELAISQYTIEHDGALFNHCELDGKEIKVTWLDGSGSEQLKVLRAFCESLPFSCLLDLNNPVEGIKNKTVLLE